MFVTMLMKDIPARDIVHQQAEKYPVIVIDDNEVSPCFSSKPADQAIDAKFTKRICTQIDEAEKYPMIVIDERNVTSSFHSNTLGDQVIAGKLARNHFKQINETEKYPTRVINEANITLSRHSSHYKQISETEKYPTRVIDEANITLSHHSSHFKQISETEKYPTIVIDEANITLSRHSSQQADQVINAKFAENDFTQINKTEKYPTIVIDEGNVTLPYYSRGPTDQITDANCTESNLTQIDEVEKDPPIIVIDETNVTVSCHSSKLVDQVSDAKFIKSNFTQIDEAEKNPTKVIEETNVASPYFTSEPADQVIDANYTESELTQTNKAEKYPTIEFDETNVTLSCYSCEPADKIINSKSTKTNFTQINEFKNFVGYPTKVIDDTSKNLPCFPNESPHKIIDEKYTKSNFTQINEVKKYPTKVVNEISTNLPCFLSQSADQGYGAQFSQRIERLQNYESRFSKRMKTEKYTDTQKTCPNIVKVKPIEQKRISDSFLLNSKNVTCNINEEKCNEINLKFNDLKVLKSSQKTSVLPKQRSKHSLNLDRNLPQDSKLGGNRIPLTVISSAKSNSQFANNSQLEQWKWKGNKIILGSKSSARKSQNKASGKQNISNSVRVLVENVGTFLSKSTRYCKNCFILFPSNKTLADHRDIMHSQFNNNQSSKSKKIIKIIKKSVNLDNKYKCNVCGRVFSSSSNLLRHKRCVHSLLIKKRKRKPNLNRNIQSQVDGKFNEITNFRCTHCNKSFSSQQILIDHMYNVLQNKPNKDGIKSIESESGEKKHTISPVFYRCPFCSYYFIQKNNYVKHLKNKHKTADNINLEKVVFDPVCKYCYCKFSKIQYFNIHIWKRHQKKLNYLPKNIVEKARKTSKCKEQTQSKVNKNSDYTSKDKVDMVIAMKNEKIYKKYLLKSVFFKCVKCNICFLTGEETANHIGHEHKRTNWKCSKCSHIFKKEEQNQHTHQHLFCDSFEVVEVDENTYLYILFKCPNCASYFREKDFFNHYSICEMQSPDSAYCKMCHILIDNNIKELHEIHHKKEGGKELNNILIETDVIAYNDETDNKVFTLLSVGLPKMESEVKQSNYICHERTDDKIYKTLNNTYKGLKGNNLTNSVIDSDAHIDNREKPKRDIEKKDIPGKRMTKAIMGKSLRFMYCGTCKAFIFVSTVRKLYNHIKGRCLNLTNYVCKYCGLVLSSKIIDSHRNLHQDVPNLTLNDFTFYDLRNGKEICPPVPKYPNCHLCEKHFITKTAIISHVCSEEYLKCPLCNIKLSKNAFSLHMSFHNYSSKSKSEISLVDLSDDSKNSHPASVIKLPHLLESNKNREDKYLLVYICKICKVAVDNYDRVIEHCHYHITSQEKEILTKPCDSCNLIFEDTCFNNHKMLHSCNQNKKFSSLTYDAFYVTAEDKVWLNHLFGSLSKNEIDNVLKNSIYNSERKITMQILQDGSPDLTFYKCAKCNSFIDPSSLYDHCRMDILCYKAKIVPCRVCGILMSEKCLIKHEKIHETQNVTTASYRFVLFNCDDDKTINHTLSLPRHYIVYECRNCNGIVDNKQFQHHKCDFDDLSKCSHCGLLLYNNDYMPHVVKHKEFCSFHESNIIVILLGAVKEEKLTCRYKPSFRGIKLDYLFYKCIRCQICHKDKQSSLTHDCDKDLAKTKCVPCDLYFEDCLFRKHRNLHESDPYFSKENITILEFDLRNSRPSGVDVIEDEKNLHDIIDITVGDDELNNTNNSIVIGFSDETVVEKHDEIFRCECGLHYLTKASALSHLTKCNNSRSSKQTCPKCGLLFKPNILYSHLLKHHGSKQVSYKFNITSISKKE